MFFLLLESKINRLKNILRRLRKRRAENVFENKRVQKALNDVLKVIRQLGFLTTVKIISEMEKIEIMKYLKESSNCLVWNFENDFKRECVPRELTEDDLFYLEQCTNSTLEEMEGPL
jgi:magnesium-transporting ATPase (P-type)